MLHRNQLVVDFPAAKLVLTYRGIVGDGLVLYVLIVSNPRNAIRLPSERCAAQFARRYHLQGYKEKARRLAGTHLVHAWELSFHVEASTKREDRCAFLGALGGVVRVVH